MLPVPLIDLPYVLIKLFRLIRVKDLPNVRACLQMNCLELRINLLLQIPRFLRGFIENLANLLCLRIGKIQYLFKVRYRTIPVETSAVG
jgi:hypothetical protein